MAGETNGALALESTEHIPIAQLNPGLSTPATTAIRAVVTLTWPYSSATGSVAFLLSEPDFRLRRTRGQVRVRFSGSSAKAIAASGIASGDEVIVCLDGVEWVSDDDTVLTPGRGIEYELRFTERLLLQFKQEDSGEIKKINIDHPVLEEPAATPAPAPARIPTPEPEHLNLPTSTPSVNRPAIGSKIGDEWSSPAFIKRARTSYGSLFEIDPFAEDDGSVPGKGRKRTRLSTTWRYTSRSPSPEVTDPEVESMDTSPEPAQKSAPTMADEGCQTVDLGSNNATEDVAQALADLSRQAINVGGAAYPVVNGLSSFGQQHSFVSFLENRASEPALPVMRTEAITHQFDDHEVEPEIPKSPRLQPIPSDALSLVSPLLSTKSNLFSRQTDDVQVDRRQPVFSHDGAANSQAGEKTVGQPLILNNEVIIQSNKEASADLEIEDIYSASPAGYLERPESGVLRFNESMGATDHAENSIIDSQFAAENQYGHWQSAGAQLSNAASPSRNEIFMEGTHGDRFYEGEVIHQGNGDSLATDAGMHRTPYPDLDNGLLGQAPSGWLASSVVYPEPSGSTDYATQYNPLPSHATPMSRSQSAQSAVVDLTESDDEADPVSHLHQSRDEYDESDEGGSAEGSSAEQHKGNFAHDRLEGDAEDGDFEDEELGSHQPIARREYEDEDEDPDSGADGEGDFEEEEEEEEEGQGVYAKPPSAFGSDVDDEENIEDLDQDEEGSFDEEEESYDEEEEEMGYDELPEPRARQEPEVIDLLSSDDEDEMPAKAPAPAVNSHRSGSSRHASDSPMPDVDTGDSGGESELGDEEIPYSERAEIKTSILGPEAEYSSSASGDEVEAEGEDEDEDEDAVYEDDIPEDELRRDSASPNDKLDSNIDPELDDSLNEHDNEDENEDIVSEEPSMILAGDKSMGGNEGMEDRSTGMADIDEDSNPDGADRISIPPDPKPTGLNADSPVMAVTTDQSLSDAIPERPSLFSRVFSLDGANDEPRFGASYRSMSREEAVLPSSIRLQQVFTGASTEHVNAQLPTPEDTQTSHKTVSLESSFSSMNGTEQPMTSAPGNMHLDRPEKALVIGDEAEDAAEPGLVVTEPSPMPDVQTSTTTITTTVEVTKGTDEMGNLQTEIHAEKVTRINEVVQTRENTGCEESIEEEESQEAVQVDGKASGADEGEDTTVLTETAHTVTMEDQIVSSHDKMQSPDDAADSRSQPDSEHGNDAADTSEIQVESPRRSTRRTNPTFKAAANVKENIRPVTPNKTVIANVRQSSVPISPAKIESSVKNTKENARPVTPAKSRVPPSASSDNDQSPLVVIDNQATPKGHDASLEFALESSDASSPPQHNLRKLPVADLKLRLTRALRTDFSEFTGLKVIRFHLTQKLDFLAVATTTPPEPQRAKNGPRQYQITFNITDPSIAPSSVTEVQVFRPYKDALPIVKAGDGILLRNFLVMSVQSRGGGPAFALRSTQEDASSWAVFKDDDEVEVRGPPVEYGEAEKNHVSQLRNWYASLDGVAQAKIARANGDKGTAGRAAGKKHSKAL
ncbi:hypothetical protein ONS95_008925 [Cadophora gregata]|uniref:uncharacterized protein n=1 Tax=Cadophora gregata TaxID=51156 RepID=UPI0026DB5A41|nr:uncharacterized protein ONS95_008925 [Cadophora gregata]KAK0123934.1 hypothetical protein ONS95_008925 [Cadophora gregata]KAK0130274.1 hypothetical protein ONS96_000797 [Cadophora gregata f. sp. sojae]